MLGGAGLRVGVSGEVVTGGVGGAGDTEGAGGVAVSSGTTVADGDPTTAAEGAAVEVAVKVGSKELAGQSSHDAEQAAIAAARLRMPMGVGRI